MAEHERAEDGAWYRVYVLTWFWLLVVTALEIGVVFAGLPRGWLVALLVVLALLKASLIAAYFMHLRYERLNLVFAVAVPLVLVVLLFAGVARDAVNVFLLRP